MYSNAFGKLSLDDNSAPFTIDSVCFVASLTKLVTAVCSMQLVERGLIGLDDDVGEVVRELSNMEILEGFDDGGKAILVKKTKPITLRWV
jgi:CubicO group peptidase (beta-lactamase class C family)